MMTEKELREKYQNEHVGNPYVEHELSFMNWRRLYIRFAAIAAAHAYRDAIKETTK